MTQLHPFHLVNKSPWPIIAGVLSLTSMLNIMLMLHSDFSSILLWMSLLTLIVSSAQWWRDVIRESTHQGWHTLIVIKGLKWGMILFIASEILFFISFFWAFFHLSLSPAIEINSWPPKTVIPFNPFQIPLLNTAILLSSGVSVTWAHHSLLEANKSNTIIALIVTVALGGYFTVLQAFEYIESPFTISDAVFGSTFFMATGFHGLHVIIGTSFLMICLLRTTANHLSLFHHFGFEAAAWYWHFVDVVWLFLFISIYWWCN